MAALLFSSTLLVLASLGPTIDQLEDGRFRVRVVFDDTSPRGNVAAQVALSRKAQDECRGKGVAVPEGTLELNDAASLRGNRKALEVAEVYICAKQWDQVNRRF